MAAGLALGYSLAYVLGVGISFRRLQKTLPDLALRPILALIGRTLLAAAPAALAAWLILRVLDADSQLLRALALAVAGVVAVVLYAVVARLLRIREVTDIVGTVLRRGRGGGPGTPPSGPTDDGNPTATVCGGGYRGRRGDGDRSDGRTRGVEETTSMRTTADDRDAYGDSTVVRPGSSPSIGASADPTPVAARPRTRIPWSPLPARTGCRVRRPRRRRHPVRPTCSAGSRRHPIPQIRAESDDESGDRPARQAPTASPRTPRPAPCPGSSTSAGTVLGYRYRMEELLAESPRSVTWRAFDLVLSRSVVVHLLAPHDPEAADILETARQAALAVDSRFLRVLDAVHSDDPELGSYVVCEYAVGRSLEVLLSHGPLSGLESAWVVREVADALSGVHGLGLYHQRINPDTVILTPDGHVKIVGLLIEAALRPAPGTALPRTPDLRPGAGRRGRSGTAALRLPGVPLARWSCLQPAGRAGRRSPPDEPAPGPGRCLPRPGRGLRPDPRRPAAAPRRLGSPRPTTWSTR